MRLDLSIGSKSLHKEVLCRVLVADGFIGCFPFETKTHVRRNASGIEGWPSRLVDDSHIFHLNTGGSSVGAELQCGCGNGDHPVETALANTRMEIVDLVLVDRRSAKERKSYMREATVVCLARGPVFALHHAVVGSGCSEGDPIPFVVCATACESGAASDLTFEVVDVGWLQVGSGRLIVAAVLIEPRDWKWIAPAVC